MYYKLLTENDVGLKIYAKIDDDGICRMSCSEENLEFQAWIAAGNTPLPPDPVPIPVPQTVTPLQAKAELLSRGLLTSVETVVNSSPDPIVPLAWNNATSFNRNSPMIASIADIMSWDSDFLDDLFIQAEKRVF